MSTHIYLVIGMTGEGEDRAEWYVRAYPAEDTANALRDRLNAWCVEHRVDTKTGDTLVGCPRGVKEKPPEDPWFQYEYYAGTAYRVDSAPFGEAGDTAPPCHRCKAPVTVPYRAGEPVPHCGRTCFELDHSGA